MRSMRGRPLEPKQNNNTIVLMVVDHNIWTRAREKAIDEDRTLSDIVETALGAFLDPTTVRPANT